jgi:hypothetical protein
MKSKRETLSQPATFSDEKWQEKINHAKQIRTDRQKARAGKSPVFATIRGVTTNS